MTCPWTDHFIVFEVRRQTRRLEARLGRQQRARRRIGKHLGFWKRRERPLDMAGLVRKKKAGTLAPAVKVDEAHEFASSTT
jgi:hypothetical protein